MEERRKEAYEPSLDDFYVFLPPIGNFFPPHERRKRNVYSDIVNDSAHARKARVVSLDWKRLGELLGLTSDVRVTGGGMLDGRVQLVLESEEFPYVFPGDLIPLVEEPR